MATKTRAKVSAKSAPDKASKMFSDEERAAMRELADERRAAARGNKVDEEGAVLAKIATMPAADRAMGERLHAMIKASAPVLSPKLWYGMPAYAKDGKVVCFFKAASKFNTRWATFGFEDSANVEEGTMWATSFGLKTLTASDAKKLGALVKKAAS